MEFWSNAPILAFGTAFVKRQMNGVAVGTFAALGLGEGGINARIRAYGAIMALRYGWVVALSSPWNFKSVIRETIPCDGDANCTRSGNHERADQH